MNEIKETPQVAARPDSNDLKAPLPTTVAKDNSSTERTKTPRWRRIVALVWDSAEGDPEYRRYVRKLDQIFLPTVLLGYFIKYCPGIFQLVLLANHQEGILTRQITVMHS